MSWLLSRTILLFCWAIYIYIYIFLSKKMHLRLKVSSTLDLLRLHRLSDLLSLHCFNDWLILRSIQELLKAFTLYMQDSMWVTDGHSRCMSLDSIYDHGFTRTMPP